MARQVREARRIVAAVHPGDACYEQVLRAAARLAHGASVHVLSIHARPIAWTSDPGNSTESQTAEARGELARRIAADAARLGLRDAQVLVPLAERASVGDDIAAHARDLDATQLVLGTHGRKGVDAWTLGSVAERVVRTAHCDVAVVRAPHPEGSVSVLAAVLPEDASYTAVLRAAGELAGGEPFAVLSLSPQPDAEYEASLHSPAERTAEAREARKQQIEADLAAMSLRATVRVPVARLSNLGDDIVARAQETGASVIVIGTRGRTGLTRLFLGSVAEWVVRHAECDVHVARPRGE